MKSLYTVNRKIKEIEDYERTNPCKQPSMFEASMTITYSQLKEIKKDLEVLKILQVLILHNGKSVGYKGIIRDFEVMLRLGKITKEQLDRFKQWLEENENDN